MRFFKGMRWKRNLARFSYLGLVLAPLLGHADTAADIRELTGAPTRAVWIQDAGATACMYSEKPTIKLMGFDTEDGKGERAILPDIGWYAKPMLTGDGTQVVFGNKADNTLEVVNFDGSDRRVVVKDVILESENEAVWTDPKTGVVWVYAMVKEQREGKPVDVIRRYRLDDPKVSELVWDKTSISMLMLSGDGRAASGGAANGGNSSQGMFTLPNGNYFQRAGGCWPSMSPDASHRMWVFTGNHRSIHFCTPVNHSGNAVTTNVRFEAPGLELKNNEEMYHPRWTNNVHFLCLDSPFSKTDWKSDAKITNEVAAKVEIYIGKFTSDFSGVERWVQLTHNTRGDYWPNVWIKPSKEDLAQLAGSAAEVVEEKTAPIDQKGVVFTWQTGAEGNQINDPSGAIRQCTGQLHGQARYGQNFVMELADGSFVPDDAAAPLLKDCQASNQFALEAVVNPSGTAATNEQVIIAFADELKDGNLVFAQQGNQLMLRLKTDGANASAFSLPLGPVIPHQSTHVVLSYADGKFACYLNGKRAILAHPFKGGFSTWTAQPLIFGDSAKGGHNWPGLLENIGLFSREISAGEARARYLQYRDRAKARKPIETILVDAKLVGPCPAADPKGIAPYRRCLSVQLYEVQKVIQGKCDDKKISIAQWSVLDAQVVPAYEKLTVGQTYRLALERMSDRPEQESERTLNGDFEATPEIFLPTCWPLKCSSRAEADKGRLPKPSWKYRRLSSPASESGIPVSRPLRFPNRTSQAAARRPRPPESIKWAGPWPPLPSSIRVAATSAHRKLRLPAVEEPARKQRQLYLCRESSSRTAATGMQPFPKLLSMVAQVRMPVPRLLCR